MIQSKRIAGVLLSGVLLAACTYGVEPVRTDGEVLPSIPVTEATAKPTSTPAPSPALTQAPAQTEAPVAQTDSPSTQVADTEPPAQATDTPILPEGPLMPDATPPVSGGDSVSARPFPAQPRDPYTVKFGSAYDDGTLSNEKLSWYYGKNTEYQPPTGNTRFDIRPFGGYHLGDITRKDIFLTFDEGYENGYTENILNTLLEKHVQAAFFVTKGYIESNPALIQRMIDEGHTVGNHSAGHKSSPELTDEEMVFELEETARTYMALTGLEMPRYFRPPMGEYSARTLKITQDSGYKTIFWSFAYMDWLTDSQPTKETAYEEIVSHMHNGAVPLLHAVSQANAEALPDVIDTLRAEGFTFRPLTELP